MTYLDLIKPILALIGIIAAIRVPYFMFFADYVPGWEQRIAFGDKERMDIGRGTSTFWEHCIRIMIKNALIASVCYLIVMYV